MGHPSTQTHRNRLVGAALVLITVAAGLVLRAGLMPVPKFAVKYGGVALWSLMVFFGLGIVCPRVSTVRIALAAACISWGVEFLQLYQSPGLDAVRSTRFGHLVLGTTFNGPDLLAYLAGIGLGVALETEWLNRWASIGAPGGYRRGKEPGAGGIPKAGRMRNRENANGG
jgi:hypothetical protein